MEHARPLVGQMTQSNYNSVYRYRPLVLAYYDVDWSLDGFKGQWGVRYLCTSLYMCLIQPLSTGTTWWPLWLTSSKTLVFSLPLLMRRITLMTSGEMVAGSVSPNVVYLVSVGPSVSQTGGRMWLSVYLLLVL